MSVKVKRNVITMTRGDTLSLQVEITYEDGTPYEPVEGDSIRFAVKKDFYDAAPLIVKKIPIETLVLQLDPADTKTMNIGEYRYDIELTTHDGRVDTFIPWTKFILTEEVI